MGGQSSSCPESDDCMRGRRGNKEQGEGGREGGREDGEREDGGREQEAGIGDET